LHSYTCIINILFKAAVFLHSCVKNCHYRPSECGSGNNIPRRPFQPRSASERSSSFSSFLAEGRSVVVMQAAGDRGKCWHSSLVFIRMWFVVQWRFLEILTGYMPDAIMLCA